MSHPCDYNIFEESGSKNCDAKIIISTNMNNDISKYNCNLLF